MNRAPALRKNDKSLESSNTKDFKLFTSLGLQRDVMGDDGRTNVCKAWGKPV